MSNPTPTAPETTESTESAPATEDTPSTEETTAPETTAEQATTETTEPKPTETVDFWKQHARTWEARAKENHAAAEKLTAAETKATEATTRADTAEAHSQALTVALEHRLGKDDVDLLMKAGDNDTMRALASRLATTGSGPYVPDQGTENAPPKPDAQREFVRDLFNRND